MFSLFHPEFLSLTIVVDIALFLDLVYGNLFAACQVYEIEFGFSNNADYRIESLAGLVYLTFELASNHRVSHWFDM